MTEIMDNILSGKSCLLSKEKGIIGSFDLFIFSCGWESRCTEVINYDNKNFDFEDAIIISFMLKDELGYEEGYMDELVSFAKKSARISKE